MMGAGRFMCLLGSAAGALIASCSGPELFLENDVLGIGGPSDRNYTNGIRYQNTITRDDAPELVRGTANLLRPFKDEDATEIGLFVGQHIYTPDDLTRSELILDDRPYAGWLYGGLSRIDSDFEANERSSDDLTIMELTLGVIGPESFAEETQTGVHGVIDANDPKGWDNQLDTEPTLMLSWLRQSRPLQGSIGPVDVDVLTLASARLGTPYTNAEVGSVVRFGRNLPKDFGVLPNEPSLVNPAVARRDAFPRSLYLFVGASGRAVGHNSFLDGNLFSDGHSVDARPFVGDIIGGFAIQRGHFRFTYTWVMRSPEFEERDDDHIFGSISVGWTARG